MSFCSTCFVDAYCSAECQSSDRGEHRQHCTVPRSDVIAAMRKYMAKHDIQLWRVMARRVEEEMGKRTVSVGNFLSHHSFLLAMRYQEKIVSRKDGDDVRLVKEVASSKCITVIRKSLHCRPTQFCSEVLATIVSIKREHRACKGVVAARIYIVDDKGVNLDVVTKMWPLL
ncbi:hypothetical protein VNI00_015269 [Paramarasmius palmivorus]|uniref:MYND-type domain-containing protein n=1 Tax=Paramarasmius palmivorus TaxID=297713 RepID=A0AAW0BM29_9AGAR